MSEKQFAHGCHDKPVRVFISYSRDSEQRIHQVRGLAQALREDGIDCMIDQFIQSPANWDLWMTQQINESAFTLIICSESYARLFNAVRDTPNGLGVTWEATLIRQQLYESTDAKVYPVFFEPPNRNLIPKGIRTSYYDLSTYHLPSLACNESRLYVEGGYQNLYRLLTGQPKIIAKPIGAVKPMMPENDPHPPVRLPDNDNEEIDSGKVPTDSKQKIIGKSLVSYYDNRRIGNFFGSGTTVNGNVVSNVNNDEN